MENLEQVRVRRNAAVEIRVGLRLAIQAQLCSKNKNKMGKKRSIQNYPNTFEVLVGQAFQQIVKNVKIALAVILLEGGETNNQSAAAHSKKSNKNRESQIHVDLVRHARLFQDIVLKRGACDTAERIKLQLHVFAEAARVMVGARLV